MPTFSSFSPFSNDITGTDGDDFITSLVGGEGTINTGAGNDTIRSFLTADETINTGSGRDFVDAGAGNDTLNAGTGVDVVLGGAGNDVLEFTEDFFAPTGGVNYLTVIGDFSSDDLIDLTGLSPDASFADLDTNGDGVIGASDDNVFASDDGTFTELFFENGTIQIARANGIPELTEDLFAFG